MTKHWRSVVLVVIGDAASAENRPIMRQAGDFKARAVVKP
jgi:hypothetical protein